MLWWKLWRLRSKNHSVRRGAADALVKIGSAAVKPLIAALKDKDQYVRIEAADALGKIGDPRAVEALIAALQDEDRAVEYHAAHALVKIGSAAVKPLIAAFKDKDRHVRKAAAKELRNIRDPRAVEPLVAALQDKKWDVRSEAANALVKIGWRPSDANQRASYAVSQQWWEAAICDGHAAVEPLVAALQDDDWDVRSKAATALGEIGDTRAVEPLAAALAEPVAAYVDKPEQKVTEAVARALVKIGPAAVTPIVRLLGNENWLVMEGVSVLEKILEAHGRSIPEEDLRRVVSMDNLILGIQLEWENPRCLVGKWKSAQGKADCSHIKQLARQEIIRRGLKA